MATAVALAARSARQPHESISQVFPDHTITVVDESWDQSVYLAVATDDTLSGIYILADLPAGEIEIVGRTYVDAAGSTASSARDVQIEGETPLWARLTLPGAAEGAAPAIILMPGTPAQLEPLNLHRWLDTIDPRYLEREGPDRHDARPGAGLVHARLRHRQRGLLPARRYSANSRSRLHRCRRRGLLVRGQTPRRLRADAAGTRHSWSTRSCCRSARSQQASACN